MNLNPSDKALVPFVSVDGMMRLIHSIGIERMLVELAEYIEADFLRWESFDKTPRVASHSDVGVIELMPTSDGEVYGFKYVNGHPRNTAEGLQTVTAFGLLADVATGYPVLRLAFFCSFSLSKKNSASGRTCAKTSRWARA